MIKNNTAWRTQDFDEEMRKLEWEIWWGSPKPKETPQEDDNVKLAYVYIGGDRKMIGVDNVTMKGYALEDKAPTWKRPLEPIEYDSFDRWCRLMDV